VGHSPSSGPTLQQQQLETEQALTTANLNLEENSQRKSILNAMQGTRVFRGSALSRALRGNTPGSGEPAPGPSRTQVNATNDVITPPSESILDKTVSRSSGTTGGGAGASGEGSGIASGGARGGGSKGGLIP
jgi:hypothetical protein